MFKIKIINTGLVRKLRHKILRKGKPFESTFFVEDDFPGTIHVGAFENAVLVGVTTLIRNDYFDELDKKHYQQYQLRGMAIDSSVQRQGIGLKLMVFSEQYLIEQNIDLLWCNARADAEAFYLKCGFKDVGPKFNVEIFGLHQTMYKKLN